MSASRKEAWHDQAVKIYEKFPELEDYSWDTALAADETFFSLLVRDMIKLDASAPGKSGPRPTLDRVEAMEKLDQIFNRDYSTKPFTEALDVMTRKASVRGIANRSGLNRNTVQRLRTGEIDPDPWHMDQIARAWNRHPSYFLEWRVLFITKAIADRLTEHPEASINVFKEMDERLRK